MSKFHEVTVICNKEHVFHPGECLACERDLLKKQLVTADDTETMLRRCLIEAMELCDTDQPAWAYWYELTFKKMYPHSRAAETQTVGQEQK